ncbi:MAG: bifunctional hydroxymethylpyrimidine kinase/phosphomethylpyrimidine kinase [Vulcanimicrobiaceae bacterium]
MIPLVLTIGATDPWNAAGLGLDVRALAACGARAVPVVAGVTAPVVTGVHDRLAMPPALIAAQFRALADAHVAAVRIGALLDAASVRAVADWLAERRANGGTEAVVYDPVFGPSGGGAFAGTETVAAIRDVLVPLVSVVTPNLDEIARLTGRSVARTSVDMAGAGHALRALGARAVLVTGGHLEGSATDVLVDRDGVREFVGPRSPGSLRGTGCLLACALAAALARDRTLPEAIEDARAFVRARFLDATEFARMRVAY